MFHLKMNSQHSNIGFFIVFLKLYFYILNFKSFLTKSYFQIYTSFYPKSHYHHDNLYLFKDLIIELTYLFYFSLSFPLFIFVLLLLILICFFCIRCHFITLLFQELFIFSYLTPCPNFTFQYLPNTINLKQILLYQLFLSFRDYLYFQLILIFQLISIYLRLQLNQIHQVFLSN